MRFFLLSLLALCLVACKSPNGEYKVAVDDDRFDLMALNMPALLASDAKSCAKIMNFARSEVVENGDLSEQMLEHTVDFWQVVDVSLLSTDDAGEVLPSGGDPKEVATILPEGVKLPTQVAHACGVYSGQVVAKIGLMSMGDGIEAAIAQDPELFVKLGTTLEKVQEGLAVISAQATSLGALPMEDRVHCVAIYQAATAVDKSLTPKLNIWMAALVQAIESGELNPQNIREQSLYWQVLANSGSEAVISTEGYQEQASKCDGWINAAITEQAAG